MLRAKCIYYLCSGMRACVCECGQAGVLSPARPLQVSQRTDDLQNKGSVACLPVCKA